MTLPARYVLPVFLLIVFLGPVVLAPLLNLALEPFGIPFHRVMSRALLISALAALVLFRSRLRLATWWPFGPLAWRQLAIGYGLAVASSTTMIALYFALGGFHSAHLSPGIVAGVVVKALVAALIVPVLEETIFRGFLISVLVESIGRYAAWVLAAFLFALAHFLKVPSDAAVQTAPWWSGAAGVASIFTHLGQGDFFSGRGLNLFLVGLVLGGIFLRTGTLWMNAALHSGWIFILMIFTALTRPEIPPHVAWLHGDLLSSPATSLVLVVFGVGLAPFRRAA